MFVLVGAVVRFLAQRLSPWLLCGLPEDMRGYDSSDMVDTKLRQVSNAM